jgi:hypothetical protein
MTTLEIGLLGGVELPDDLDDLQVWDEALAGLRRSLTGEAFGGRGAPALLLVSLPEPLFAAWAAWRDPEALRGDAVLVEVDAGLHVAPQAEADTWFLGPSTVFVMAADAAETWCPRAVHLPVAEVVRRHARSLSSGTALAA